MIHIVFEEPEFNIDIFKVEIIWDNDDTENTEMHKNINGVWSAEINELPKGTYTYRFLINGIFTINDYNANIYEPDKEGKLWSALVIDSEGRRLYNNTQYSVHIEDVQITDDYYEDIDDSIFEFDSSTSKQVVVRYEFAKITGAHTASVLWINPSGRIKAWSEEIIMPSVDKNLVWFGLDTSNIYEEDSGEWNILLLIDGKYILSHSFSLKYAERKAIPSFSVTI